MLANGEQGWDGDKGQEENKLGNNSVTYLPSAMF